MVVVAVVVVVVVVAVVVAMVVAAVGWLEEEGAREGLLGLYGL